MFTSGVLMAGGRLWGGAKRYMRTLYLLLNFPVNLKLL